MQINLTFLNLGIIVHELCTLSYGKEGTELKQHFHACAVFCFYLTLSGTIRAKAKDVLIRIINSLSVIDLSYLRRPEYSMKKKHI